MATKIRPLHDRVVVRRRKAEETSPGGIVIPDTARNDKPDQGEVFAVGPGKICEDGKVLKPAVKIGDQILFGKYSGTDVKLNDDEFVVMREDDIMGVIEA